MALSCYSPAILARPEYLGFEGKRYANAQVGNGFRTGKPVKIKRQQIQAKNVKIRSEQLEVVNLQPCLVRREALAGLGTSFLTIVLLPSESAEAKTVKPDVRKKIREKLDELREKAGLKIKNEDEKSLTDGKKIPKAPSELAQK